MKKRVICIILALIMILAAFAGCGKKEKTPEETPQQSEGQSTAAEPSGQTSEPEAGGKPETLEPSGETESEQPQKREPRNPWEPEYKIETEEYTYGIEDFSVQQTESGKYRISFTLGAFFNYEPTDFDIEGSFPAFATPEVAVTKDFSAPLEKQTLPMEGNYYKDPAFAAFEYECDTKPEKVYIKTPQMYIAPRGEVLEIESAELGKYGGTSDTVEGLSLTFPLPGELGCVWNGAELLIAGETVKGTAQNKSQESVTYAFRLPDGANADGGYTLRLSAPGRPVERQVFEIEVK